LRFLSSALPETIDSKPGSPFEHIRTREDFIKDVSEGIDMAPMAIRLTPHVLSVVDWGNALDDPIRRQFIPMKSSALPDHRMLTFDSLHEEGDSPVKGLVHRYADKALFLGNTFNIECSSIDH
jgi:lysine 2,3-aminomutase